MSSRFYFYLFPFLVIPCHYAEIGQSKVISKTVFSLQIASRTRLSVTFRYKIYGHLVELKSLTGFF